MIGMQSTYQQVSRTMSNVSNETYLSMDSRMGSSVTAEEERDHYRQRFLSMKLVLKELQQQLALYKTRCTGVDTVALMLKESKEEVIKLTRQRKALETAVTNLQNRLSTNGLSSRVNIEETELFVPGASKQTLDNLARENARLRSLLKNAEGHSGKKPSEDYQSMKASIENMEAENNQLRAQLLEMENLKINIVRDCEEAIKKMKNEHEAEKSQLEQELNQYIHSKNSVSKHNKDDTDVETKSEGCQTMDIAPSRIDEFRKILKQLSEHCLQLDLDLENAHSVSEYDVKDETIGAEKNGKATEEYLELERKLTQVIQMNQRWQTYNESQEQQIHFLNAKIAELEDYMQECEKLRQGVDAKEVENQKLRQQVQNLAQEANRRKSQPQYDTSMIEILKQQIQVCTEDFNTERKDREQAVTRAKQLQEEVSRLKKENDALRMETESFKKVQNTESPLERRDALPWTKGQTTIPQFKARGAQMPPQRIPFSLISSQASSSAYGSASPSSSFSPVPSPLPMSLSSVGDRSSSYAPSSQESAVEFQGPAQIGAHRQQMSRTEDFMSLPRGRGYAAGGTAAPVYVQNPPSDNVSMPALSRKSDKMKRERGPYLTCPKCGKEFTEDQNSELLRHIDACTD